MCNTLNRHPIVHSEANVMLNDIVAALTDLEVKALDFLDAHGIGCGCPFCAAPEWEGRDCNLSKGTVVEDDVRGLLYNVRMAISVLGGEINLLDPDQLAEARQMLDAEPELADDEPEPSAIVIG